MYTHTRPILGEGFVAGSHYVSVSNTERPLQIEREEGRYTIYHNIASASVWQAKQPKCG